MGRRVRARAGALAGLVAALGGLLVAGCGGGSTPVAKPTATTTSTSPLHRSIVAPTSRPAVPPSTLLADLPGSVPRYASPGGAVVGTVPGTWYGEPSVLPVITETDGYLQVRLAQRPNGSTAWIKQSSVTLGSTPYRIVVNVDTFHLMFYKSGALVLDAPAGVGTLQDPTPTGHFFVAFFAAAPSPAWGPYVMVTSGHSDAISDWEESGDAIVAIHGPLGADAEIGTTGARVSHGCVRLHVPALEELRVVPVGTPVDIIS